MVGELADTNAKMDKVLAGNVGGFAHELLPHVVYTLPVQAEHVGGVFALHQLLKVVAKILMQLLEHQLQLTLFQWTHLRFGGSGDSGPMGESLVQEHAQRKKAEEEVQALSALRRACPGASDKLLVAALEEAGWERERALTDLREYSAALGRNSIFEQPPKKSRSTCRRKRSHNRSRSRSRSPKRKPSKRKEKHQVSARSRSVENRAQKEFGARGIIRSNDMDRFRGEMDSWLVEKQGVSPESLSQRDLREWQSKFVEEYNTDSLHEKYRDLEAWEQKYGLRAADEELYGAFTDEERRKQELEAQRRQQKWQESEQLKDVLRDSEAVDDYREQQRLHEKLQLAAKTGDMAQAEQLRQRLAPEDMSTKYGASCNYGFKPS